MLTLACTRKLCYNKNTYCTLHSEVQKKFIIFSGGLCKTSRKFRRKRKNEADYKFCDGHNNSRGSPNHAADTRVANYHHSNDNFLPFIIY